MEMSAEQILWKQLRTRLPRILSQLSRDPDAPTFGSWDRNFWHYKMRDFSSMILQQGMIVVNSLRDYPSDDNPLYQNLKVEEWVDASLGFWADQQLKNGSFNEYYPFEAGYPPTAFSLYAVGLVLKSRSYKDPGPKVHRAVQKAVNWLLKHPEKEALNQEAAGLAGIVLCSALPGIHVDQQKLERRLKDFYGSQSPEGWFPEYGGPDTGYLAVTIDCLWEIYEATGDLRAYSAIGLAVDYIGSMISVSSETPVMINSRNTDYLVIYGITRMALEGNTLAEGIVRQVIAGIHGPDHFLNRTDDRYSVHYVYSSYFRSLKYLKNLGESKAGEPARPLDSRYYPMAGILVSHRKGTTSLYVNLKKGGIVSIYDEQGVKAVDFGWRMRVGPGKVAVTHWQNINYKVEVQDADNIYKVSGEMTLHGWMVPGPLKHMALRFISFLFGSRLIPLLKKVMIFNDKGAGIPFQREVFLADSQVVLKDDFRIGEEKGQMLFRAPHYSLRHVSSAGQFVPEELLPVDGGNVQQTGDHAVATRVINI